MVVSISYPSITFIQITHQGNFLHPMGACGLGPFGPPWALVGQALVGSLVPCGLGPCGPPGPLWAGPLWLPWALLGWASWALTNWASVAPLGPYVPGPYGSSGPLMGRGLDGHPSKSKIRFYGEPAEPFGHP